MLLFLLRYTYEVSPVFLLVEEAVIKKMIEFIGWEEGDGIFNPGKNSSDFKLSHYKATSTSNSMNIGLCRLFENACKNPVMHAHNYLIQTYFMCF